MRMIWRDIIGVAPGIVCLAAVTSTCFAADTASQIVEPSKDTATNVVALASVPVPCAIVAPTQDAKTQPAQPIAGVSTESKPAGVAAQGGDSAGCPDSLRNPMGYTRGLIVKPQSDDPPQLVPVEGQIDLIDIMKPVKK